MTNASPFCLEGKTAFVTGGTRGIGLSIACTLQKAGAHVVIHGSTLQGTQMVALQHGFDFVYADFCHEDEYTQMVLALHEKLDKLDILFNNAGFESHSAIEHASNAYLNDIYQVNARVPYHLVRDLLDMLRKSASASVINVTSIHQEIPVRGNSAYCMAKASLAMFTKVAALELAKWNIRVNNLVPGAILTDMNRELVHELPFQKWIPMGRAGEVDDLTGPALMLASDASRYMTGSSIVVDGGYSLNLLRYGLENEAHV